jgi:hypothetical protein
LTIQYSTKYFRPLPMSDPASLEPEVLVPYSFDDYLAGRDPIFDAALHR